MTMVKIIRLADIEAEYKRTLLLDVDYQLDSLNQAKENNDEVEMEKCKSILKKLTSEIEWLDNHEGYFN